jgi:hypothetical protein
MLISIIVKEDEEVDLILIEVVMEVEISTGEEVP